MIQAQAFSEWLAACLLLTLRIAPVLALAPPFTLAPTPAVFRVLLGLALSGLILLGQPALAQGLDLSAGGLAAAGARELFLGGVFVMILQVAFGAIYFAGRTIDVQVGLGLAGVIEPGTRAQLPLVGTVLAVMTGAMFFAVGGHLDLLRVVHLSLQAVPLGEATAPASLAGLTTYVSVCFLLALGAAGGVILVLFLTDLSIALLSRTAPQMNVLLLGFQAKTMLLLFVLPFGLGATAAVLLRLITFALESLLVVL